MSDAIVLGWESDAAKRVGRWYGASHCKLTTSGTTRLIQNAQALFAARGTKIAIGSDAHIAWSAATQFYRMPMSVLPARYDSELEILFPPSPKEYERAATTGEADSFLLTYPYDPLELNFQAYIHALGDADRGILDGAWLDLEHRPINGFPIVFVSLHKRCGAPQGVSAVLNYEFDDWPLLSASLEVLDTTSPDWKKFRRTSQVFRFYERRPAVIGAPAVLASFLRHMIRKAGFRVLQDDDARRSGTAGTQRSKIHVLLPSNPGVSGYRLSTELRKHGIVAEKAGPRSLCILGTFRRFSPKSTGIGVLRRIAAMDVKETARDIAHYTVERIRECFEELADEGEDLKVGRPPLAHEQETVIPPERSYALLRNARLADLRVVAKKVAAVGVAPYPPGCEILHSGQRWDGATRDYCLRLLELGAEIRGVIHVAGVTKVWIAD